MFLDIIGYIAAIFNNISMYPQAYNVYKIIKKKEYNQLNTLSLYTLIYITIGCNLWLYYAIEKNIYPIILGCILCLIPTGYIIICKLTFYDEIIIIDDIYFDISGNNIEDELNYEMDII